MKMEEMAMGEYCRTAVFEPAGAGGFVVTRAAFPGLVTAGGTMEEARTMLTLKAGGKSSPLLPSLKNKDVLRVPGWFVHHVKHPDKPRPRVTQPRHSTDLKRRTLTSMLELAGCKVDEFVELFRGQTNQLRSAAGQRAMRIGRSNRYAG